MHPLLPRRSLRVATVLLLCIAVTPPSASAEVARWPPSFVHTSRWLPPFDGPLQVSTAYQLPHGPYQAGHRGIDVPAVPGAVVSSPTTGVVSFVGVVVDRPVLSIRVDSTTVLSLEPATSDLAVGEPVQRGQAIAVVASGGHCGEDCLHLGVRVNGNYVNPMRFLLPRAELIPW